MARSSMAALITRCRRYIGDPAGGSQHYDDNSIQDALDEHRFTARLAELRPAVTLHPGGIVEYADYYSDAQQWEDDYTLQWVNYVTLTPVLSEPIAGHWQFSNPQPGGQYPPVLITGKYYDVHAAAADLLEQWAASVALAYSFSSDGQTFNRNQMSQMLLAAAQTHRRQQLITSAPFERRDLQEDVPAINVNIGGMVAVNSES